MSDFSHALSLVLAGLALTGLGAAMSWHCWRSMKSGMVQVSIALVVNQDEQPKWFSFVIVFFSLCAAVLVTTGASCLAVGIVRF